MTPKVLVISACSGSKAVGPVVDCGAIDTSSREALIDAYPDASLPARSLYTGDEHEHVEAAVDRFEGIADVEWRIISAGFGLIRPNTVLPAYECTFQETDSVRRRVARMGHDPEAFKNPERIQRLAEELAIPGDVHDAFRSETDVAFVLLGKDYLKAVGSGLSVIPDETTAFAFAAEGTRDLIGECRWVPSTETERKALGTTWSRMKGLQLRRVAEDVETTDDLHALKDAEAVRDMSIRD